MYADSKFVKSASILAELFQQVSVVHLANVHGHDKILNLIANRLVADAGVPISPNLIEIDYPTRSHIDSQYLLHIPEFDLYLSAEHGSMFNYDHAVAKFTEKTPIKPLEVYSRKYKKVDDYSLIEPSHSQLTVNLLSKQFERFEELVDAYAQSLQDVVIQDVVEVLNDALNNGLPRVAESAMTHLDTITNTGEIFEIDSYHSNAESGISIFTKRDYKLVTFNIFAQQTDPSNGSHILVRVEPTGDTTSVYAIDKTKDTYPFESILLNNPGKGQFESLVAYSPFCFYTGEVAKYLDLYNTMPEGVTIARIFEEGHASGICEKIQLTKARALAILNCPDATEGLEAFIQYYDTNQQLYELSCIVEVYLSGQLSQQAHDTLTSIPKSQHFQDLIASHELARQLESLAPSESSIHETAELDTSLRMSL